MGLLKGEIAATPLAEVVANKKPLDLAIRRERLKSLTPGILCKQSKILDTDEHRKTRIG